MHEPEPGKSPHGLSEPARPSAVLKLLWKAFLWCAPPPRWRLPVTALVGVTLGLGTVIFYQSRAWSYLSDDPTACINCHIMVPQYTTWKHSSHGRDVSCNDCHVPHTSMAAKYFFKAKDGLRHSTLFTLGMEDQVIRITPPSMAVVQENCVRCHGNLNHPVGTDTVKLARAVHGDGHLCWECHREVPHGRVNSLSSVPNARVQLETRTIPDWIRTNPTPHGETR